MDYSEIHFRPDYERDEFIDIATIQSTITAYNDAVRAIYELARYAGRRSPAYVEQLLQFRHAPIDKILYSIQKARLNMSHVTGQFQKEDVTKILHTYKDYELYYQETKVYINGLNISYNLDTVFAFDKFVHEFSQFKKTHPQIKHLYIEDYKKITGFIEKTRAKCGSDLAKCLDGNISTANAIEIVQKMQDDSTAIYIPEFYIVFQRFNNIKTKYNTINFVKDKSARQHRREKRIDSSFAVHQEIYQDNKEKIKQIQELQEQVAKLKEENTILKQQQKHNRQSNLIKILNAIRTNNQY